MTEEIEYRGPLGGAPDRALVTSYSPAPNGAPLYWVIAHDLESTVVRSVASGRLYDWPNAREVDVVNTSPKRPEPYTVNDLLVLRFHEPVSVEDTARLTRLADHIGVPYSVEAAGSLRGIDGRTPAPEEAERG